MRTTAKHNQVLFKFCFVLLSLYYMGCMTNYNIFFSFDNDDINRDSFVGFAYKHGRIIGCNWAGPHSCQVSNWYEYLFLVVSNIFWLICSIHCTLQQTTHFIKWLIIKERSSVIYFVAPPTIHRSYSHWNPIALNPYIPHLQKGGELYINIHTRIYREYIFITVWRYRKYS